MSLKNAYPPPPPGQTHHLLTSRVAPADYLFLKRYLPYTFAVSDIVVSKLFKAFIDELRNQHATEPFQLSLHVGDDNYQRIQRILERCNFRDDPGRSGSQDVERGVDGVRETVQPNAEQRTNEKSSTPRRQRAKSKKSERAKEK